MVVTSHEYLPFGEDWITEGNTKNAPKYNSQELDKESGYYFYNARHYDPEIARFVTPDTVIDGELSTQGWNRYAYCHNNPIVYKDPTGHEAQPSGVDLSKGINQLVNSVKSFFTGGNSSKNNVAQQMQKANDKTVKSSTYNSCTSQTKIENIGANNLKTVNGNRTPINQTDFDNDKIKITSKFGKRTDPKDNSKKEFHPGIDIKAPEGTKIYSTKDGKVWVAGIGPTGINQDYGRRLYINHDNNEQTLYGHTSKIYVQPGQEVKAGQHIADVGNTGKSTGPHLHYELRKDGKPIDPIPKKE